MISDTVLKLLLLQSYGPCISVVCRKSTYLKSLPVCLSGLQYLCGSGNILQSLLSLLLSRLEGLMGERGGGGGGTQVTAEGQGRIYD